jgi:hypothetical protein
MTTYHAFNGSFLLILLLVIAGIVVLTTWPTDLDGRRQRLDEQLYGFPCEVCHTHVVGTLLPPATWLCESCEHDLAADPTESTP